MFGLVISFQGNMIKMHYPEISSYRNEEENWRTRINMKTVDDDLCNYTVYIAKISKLHYTLVDILCHYTYMKMYINICCIYDS